MNQFNAIGRLTRDAETRAVGGGQTVSGLSLAINESWKDKATGEWKEKTLFLKANAWGNLSGKATNLKKGDIVFIAGSLESRKWAAQDGSQRESIELRASNLESINPIKAGASSGDDWKNKGKKSAPSESFSPDLDDEIPF